MKLIFTLLLMLTFSISFSQWTRVTQLPSTNIFSLFHKGNVLYAGGTNVIYISNDRGQSWDSTTAIPQLSSVSSSINSIIIYKNELYAASPSKGVFKSVGGGTSWLDISSGIFPEVSDFCEFKGELYAATLGNSVYKLNAAGNNWIFFSNGLSGLSANINSIAANSNALIAGTNANGLYDYLPANSTTWEERFLLNQISPNEGVFDIITGHDTLFLAGKTGKFYMSTDNGLNWSLFGNRLVTGATFIVNAKQALISSRYIFDGVNNISLFYYIKKDSLQHPFVNFSILTGNFTWKIDIVGNKLWAATDRGLYFISLSDLPGITNAEDTVVLSPLPLHFISFAARCEENKVQVKWKTGEETNNIRYNIERSENGSGWITIGTVLSSGNGAAENSYTFTDTSPVQTGYYRIAAINRDGKVLYSTIIKAPCTNEDAFSFFPNPVQDKVIINIISASYTKALIQVYDNKGALIKLRNETLIRGSNTVNVEMEMLPKGVYFLSVAWNNGLIQKKIKLIKQ